VKGLPFFFLRWNNIGTSSVIHEILHTFFCYSHTQTRLNLCVTVKRLIYIRPFLRPKANGYGPSVIQVHKLRLFVHRLLNISYTFKQNISVYASFIAN